MAGEPIVKLSSDRSLKRAIFQEFDLKILRSQALDIDLVSMSGQWFKRHKNQDGSKGAFISIINTNVAKDVQTSPNAVIMHDVTIGSGSRVLFDSTVQPHAIIGDRVVLGSHSILERGVKVETNSFIGPNVSIGQGSVLAYGVVVEGESQIGRNASLAACTIVRTGASVADNQIVSAGDVVEKAPGSADLAELKRPVA